MSKTIDGDKLTITATPGDKLVITETDVTMGVKIEHCYYDGTQWVCSSLVVEFDTSSPQNQQ